MTADQKKEEPPESISLDKGNKACKNGPDCEIWRALLALNRHTTGSAKALQALSEALEKER